jgi:hypothetical protein
VLKTSVERDVMSGYVRSYSLSPHRQKKKGELLIRKTDERTFPVRATHDKRAAIRCLPVHILDVDTEPGVEVDVFKASNLWFVR